jgi:DNA-binding NtrC family response regulator
VILIVDDNELLRELLRDYFRQFGWEVLEADGLVSASKILGASATRIAIVLSDDAMGGEGLNGSDLFFQRSTDLEIHGIPFVLMTGALADLAFIKAAEEFGMKVLQKPFSLGRAADMVRSLVKQWPSQPSTPPGGEQ